MPTFAERLKELRKEKNLKQTDMAEVLKITPRHYQQYEYGKVDPPTSTTSTLAKYFDVSTDYLLGLSNKKKPTGLCDALLFCRVKMCSYSLEQVSEKTSIPIPVLEVYENGGAEPDPDNLKKLIELYAGDNYNNIANMIIIHANDPAKYDHIRTQK